MSDKHRRRRVRSDARDSYDDTDANTSVITNPFDEKFNERKPTVTTTPLSNSNQQQQQQQLDQRSNEEILNDTIRVCDETSTLGAETLMKLKAQREQIERADNNLSEIDESMTRSERLIRGIKSIGGALANAFSRPSASNTTTTTTASTTSKTHVTSNGTATMKSTTTRQSVSTAPAGRGAAYGSSKAPSIEDEQLDTLDVLMSGLKGQATAMNTELTTQNDMLTNLDTHLTSTNARIKRNNRQVDHIIAAS